MTDRSVDSSYGLSGGKWCNRSCWSGDKDGKQWEDKQCEMQCEQIRPISVKKQREQCEIEQSSLAPTIMPRCSQPGCLIE